MRAVEGAGPRRLESPQARGPAPNLRRLDVFCVAALSGDGRDCLARAMV
jgi:hypothetical protein